MKTTKVMRIGTLSGFRDDRRSNLFIKANIEDGKFLISGVIGPRANGDADGGCGQISMEFAHRDPAHNDRRYSQPIPPEQIEFAPEWNADKWLDLLDAWHKWHLNDMKAGCEHQAEWDTQKEIEVISLTWGEEYHRLRREAESGTMPPDSYAGWSALVEQVEALTIGLNTPKHPARWGETGNQLLARHLVKVEKTEHKAAGWVDHREHPEGLLCKPCSVCGYKYGSAWRKVELPAAVVEFIQSLPDTDKQPPWV